MLTGKKFSYYENGKFQYILSPPIGKIRLREKVAVSGEDMLHSIVVFRIAREMGKLLSDNISIIQMDNCQTCSSVVFKTTHKAMNSIKCHIHNLFQFNVKKC